MKVPDGEHFPKRAYSLLFEPYDWIISTGNYYDDIDETVSAMREQDHAALRNIILLLSTFSLLAIAVYIALIFALSRSLTMLLRKVEFALDGIAEGAGTLTQRYGETCDYESMKGETVSKRRAPP